DGITGGGVGGVGGQEVGVGGAVDWWPISLRGATVDGERHDVFVVTTSYGKTIAVDADTGSVLWRFTPPGYASWVGSYRITNSTPVADPGRRFLYSASPDGRIHKLAFAKGREDDSGCGPVRSTSGRPLGEC